jgi:hypothetical protein
MRKIVTKREQFYLDMVRCSGMIERLSRNFYYALVVQDFVAVFCHENKVLKVVLMSKVVGPCVYILGLVYTIHTISSAEDCRANFYAGRFR